MKKAFTMIELVFVIVVLGILAAIAVPKFAATRTDAQIAKGKADVASIRSAIISDRQAKLITGNSAYIDGDDLNTNTTNGLFGGVLMYAISSGTTAGHWRVKGTATTATSEYYYKVDGKDVVFTYTKSSGKFDCNTTHATHATQCKYLVN